VGFFDSSRTENTTNLFDQTTTFTEQTDQSGNSGLNFSGVGGGVSLATSENYSLSDSHDIFDSRSSSSSTSIANAGNPTLSDSGAIAAGRELGLGGLKAALDSLLGVTGFASDSLSTLERVNADSLDMLGALATQSIDASRTLARDSAESTSGFLQQAVSGFGALAKASSEGESDKITRVVGFALLAVAVVVIGPAIFRGGGKGVLA
jgi:hypothetical protein